MSTNLRCTVAVYATGALCYLHVLPWAALPVMIFSTFGRWAFDIHAYTHHRGKIPAIVELMLLVQSPFSVGLNEQRVVHQSHHEFFYSTADMDSLYYRAKPCLALALCLLHPEITLLRSLAWMPPLAIARVGIRAVLFFGLWALVGQDFLLWYVLPMRLVFGAAQWVFTWVLHHGQNPTINLELPGWLTPLIGAVGMKALRSHVEHHGKPSAVPAGYVSGNPCM